MFHFDYVDGRRDLTLMCLKQVVTSRRHLLHVLISRTPFSSPLAINVAVSSFLPSPRPRSPVRDSRRWFPKSPSPSSRAPRHMSQQMDVYPTVYSGLFFVKMLSNYFICRATAKTRRRRYHGPTPRSEHVSSWGSTIIS